MTRTFTPKKLLIIFLLGYLVLGIFIVGDFGIGIDHSQIIARSEISLRRYHFPDPGDPIAEYLSQGVNQYYGTGLTSIFLLAEKTIGTWFQIQETRVFYYFTFISFVAGCYGIFVLTKRWVSDWAALGAALLFGLQPLFFGHSFINPKDIPGMVIFILTMAAGFKLADSLSDFTPLPSAGSKQPYLGDNRQALSSERKLWLKRFAWVWLGAILVWMTPLPGILVRRGIQTAYNAPESGWLGRTFRQLAPSAANIPVEDYVQRAQALAGLIFFWIVLISLLAGIGIYLWYLHGPQQTLRETIKQYLGSQPLKRFWKNSFISHSQAYQEKRRGYWLVALAAGAVWGLAISVRITNITAGGMIGLYILLKYRERAILPLTAYTLTALAATFAAWPYLWYFGLQGFFDGLTAFSDYPFEGGVVWFRGVIPIEDLPPTYLPHTMAIQFTEPLVILSLLGIVLAVILAVRKKFPGLDLFILLGWIGLPLMYAALAHPTLYNNFRQFFFITPPLFVFSAVAIDWVRKRVKNSVVLAALLLVVLAPGLIEIVRLHPYQYVYYNQFVGGTEGAAGLYELDYWSISFREMLEYVNEHTPENGAVMSRYGNDIPHFYGRPDIKFTPLGLETTPQGLAEFDFALMTTNGRFELKYLDMNDYPTVYEVYAGDTLLAVVKQP